MTLKTFLRRKFGFTRAAELAQVLDMNTEHVRGYWTGRVRLTPLFAAKLQRKLPAYVGLDDLLKLNDRRPHANAASAAHRGARPVGPGVGQRAAGE